MHFEQHKDAVIASGGAWADIYAVRGDNGSWVMWMADIDLSGDALVGHVASTPDSPRLASFEVVASVPTQTTWADIFAAHGIEPGQWDTYLPAGVSSTDLTDYSTLTLSWAKTRFLDLPRASTTGEPSPHYYETKRKDGSGSFIVAGCLILMESI